MASSTSEQKKTVTLISSDGIEFEIDESVGIQLGQIKDMIEDGCVMGSVPVSKVDSHTLAAVIEYCKKHAHDAGIPYSVLKKFDAEFLDVSTDELYYLLLAANFLTCQGLLDMLAKHVANMIAGKSSEEIRQMFNIKNDLEEGTSGKANVKTNLEDKDLDEAAKKEGNLDEASIKNDLEEGDLDGLTKKLRENNLEDGDLDEAAKNQKQKGKEKIEV